MAKTLIYAEGSTRSVKIGDTNTSLYLQIAQDNVNVDLATAKSINVKVRSRDSFVKTIEITSDDIQSIPGVIQVPLNNANIGGLPDGDYYFEVWVVNADDQSEIYPDIGVANFSIVNNVESGSIIYTSLTLQDFENRFNELDANVQNALTISKSAQEISTAASDTATQAATGAEQTLNDLKNGNYAKKTDTVAAANKLASGAKINGTNFDGSADINVKAANDANIVHLDGAETISGAKTFSSKIIASAGVAGNADTATKLNTPVAINGVSFDGSSSISVNPIDSGWQNGTLLNGATASKYQYRTIGGVVYVHVVNLAIRTAGKSGIFQVPYIINGETIAEEDLATYTYSAATLMDVTNGVFSPLVSAAAGHYLSFSGSFPIN
ncbi:MAG: hypothetical protein ABF470_00225 [Liquorilactobacillus sp.]|uniref:hypothetical protein n=1 Tax=Liquorilactobacillus TaxID=2767888 RepID=UPI0039EAF798